MEGRNVVTSDDHKLGTVVAERDGFVVVESGHMFKSRHAIPIDFLHEHEDVVRATVGKDVVHDSPKVDGDTFDEYAVKMHYGLVEVNVVDPEPRRPKPLDERLLAEPAASHLLDERIPRGALVVVGEHAPGPSGSRSRTRAPRRPRASSRGASRTSRSGCR